MGGACFKGGVAVVEPRIPRDTPHQAWGDAGASDSVDVSGVSAQLAPLLAAASKKVSSLSDDALDEVLRAIPAIEASELGPWFAAWSAKNSAKHRAGVVALSQRLLARALDSPVAAAEEVVAKRDSSSNVGDLAAVCEDLLRLDESCKAGVAASAAILSAVARADYSAQVVPAFDRFVLVFRHALLADVAAAFQNLQRLREFFVEVRWPSVDHHLGLLGCTAQAALLGLILAPEGSKPLQVVVRRGAALRDAVPQLPDGNACALSPYFEDEAGTKVVQGKHVEGGEGQGPRKEFFNGVCAESLERWSIARVAQAAPDSAEATLTVDDCNFCLEGEAKPLRDLLQTAKAGNQIQLTLACGFEVLREVRSVPGDGSLSVNESLDEAGLPSPAVLVKLAVRESVRPLFEFHRGSGLQWFGAYANDFTGPRGEDLRCRFFAFGKLLALALASHCKLSFALPELFFRFLLHHELKPELQDLIGFDRLLHSNLKRCLKMKQAHFKALKELEGCPDAMTREEYVADQLSTLVCPEGMKEVRRGFWRLASGAPLADITASELRQMLCPTEGAKELDLRKIFKFKMDDEMSENSVFMEAFWAVLKGLSQDEKKQFLVFVTGLEVPPEPGVERLLVELPFSAFTDQEHVEMLDKLPQAHTCTNTLELPNYHEALVHSGRVSPDKIGPELRRHLGEKLRFAMLETGGYELDALDSGAELSADDAAEPGPWRPPDSVQGTPWQPPSTKPWQPPSPTKPFQPSIVVRALPTRTPTIDSVDLDTPSTTVTAVNEREGYTPSIESVGDDRAILLRRGATPTRPSASGERLATPAEDMFKLEPVSPSVLSIDAELPERHDIVTEVEEAMCADDLVDQLEMMMSSPKTPR